MTRNLGLVFCLTSIFVNSSCHHQISAPVIGESIEAMETQQNAGRATEMHIYFGDSRPSLGDATIEVDGEMVFDSSDLLQIRTKIERRQPSVLYISIGPTAGPETDKQISEIVSIVKKYQTKVMVGLIRSNGTVFIEQ